MIKNQRSNWRFPYCPFKLFRRTNKSTSNPSQTSKKQNRTKYPSLIQRLYLTTNAQNIKNSIHINLNNTVVRNQGWKVSNGLGGCWTGRMTSVALSLPQFFFFWHSFLSNFLLFTHGHLIFLLFFGRRGTSYNMLKITCVPFTLFQLLIFLNNRDPLRTKVACTLRS